MAIIYTYPVKTSLVAGDKLVISDSADGDKTKTITAQEIADFVDGEVTLQEVLNTGNRASSNGSNISQILLQDSTPTTTITLNGSNGEITTTGNISADGTLGVAGLSTLATVDINGGNIDDTVVGGTTPRRGTFTFMTASTVDIDGGNIDDTVIGASIPAAGNFSTVDINGGTIDNTLIGSSFASEAKFATQGTNSAVQVVGNLTGAAALRVFQGPIQFGNTGGVGYGNVGDVIISNGSAGTPEWLPQGDLSVGRIIEDVQFSSAVIKGTAVYISGPAHGSGRPTVDIADADGASTKMPVIGLALEDYAAGQGQVIVTGILDDINLTTHGTFSVGDVLYIKDQGGSPSNTNLQNTKPIGDAKIQNIGIIAKPGANGSIQVSCIGRTNDLPNNNANTLFSANASGFPVSTIGKLEVDVANDTIKIGEQALTTDVTITSDNFRAEVTNNTAAGFNNFVIGQGALNQAFVNGGTGLNNTALGINAMSGNLASGAMSSNYNVAVGQGALASGTGLTGFLTNNTAIGYFAMRGGTGGAGPTTFNTAVGSNALQNINSNAIPSAADLNTAIGSSALFNLTSGEENTSLGSSSGTGVTTGDYNTFIGAQTNTSSGNIQFATTIGYNADVLADAGVALGSNTVVTGVGGVALGSRAVAAANRLNIKVDNIGGPTLAGGLPQVPVAGPLPPAGLVGGDVYVITGVTLPGAPGPANILAIV